MNQLGDIMNKLGDIMNKLGDIMNQLDDIINQLGEIFFNIMKVTACRDKGRTFKSACPPPHEKTHIIAKASANLMS